MSSSQKTFQGLLT